MVFSPGFALSGLFNDCRARFVLDVFGCREIHLKQRHHFGLGPVAVTQPEGDEDWQPDVGGKHLHGPSGKHGLVVLSRDDQYEQGERRSTRR